MTSVLGDGGQKEGTVPVLLLLLIYTMTSARSSELLDGSKYDVASFSRKFQNF